MFCVVCVSACTNSAPTNPHHCTLQSLSESAQLGCPTCVELHNLLPRKEYPHNVRDTIPCTVYTGGLSRGYFYVQFSRKWIAQQQLEKKLGEHLVEYSIVDYTEAEFQKEMQLREWPEATEVPWDREIVTKLFGASTASDQSWRLIRHWVTDCDQHHHMCTRRPDVSWLPTRLIQVGEINEDPRLCIPDVTSWNPDDCYITLSHRWGSNSSRVAQLEKGNLATLQESIPTGRLSQTYKDAISITRALGVRFLWIDSLCIVQGDEEDWAREAGRMSLVYSNSYLNISATSAGNGDQGCYRERNPVTIAGHVAKNVSQVSEGEEWSKMVHSKAWSREVDDAPLSQRGWVLQERLLSPRVLHFSTNQVLWECRENYACESLPISVPDHFRTRSSHDNVYLRDFVPKKPAAAYGKLSGDFEAEMWGEIAETYSRASLTYRADKLIALSGIAKEMQYLLKSTYVAGLWKRHLPQCLLWTSLSGCRRLEDYVAPSWSWASVDGPVVMRSIEPEYDYKGATILDVGVDLVTSDPFGQVKGGWIRIRGRMCVAAWEEGGLPETTISFTNHGLPPQVVTSHVSPEDPRPLSGDLDVSTEAEIRLDDVTSTGDHKTFFLLFYSSEYDSWRYSTGLLLKLTPSGEYVRIGLLSFFDKGENSIFDYSEERTIVIV